MKIEIIARNPDGEKETFPVEPGEEKSVMSNLAVAGYSDIHVQYLFDV